MKLTIEKAALLNALAKVVPVANRVGIVPIFCNVALKAEGEYLTLRTTNGDMEAKVTIPAAIARPGETTVNAARLFEIARNVPVGAEIAMDFGDDPRVKVSSGRSRFMLPVFPYADFPVLEKIKYPVQVQVSAAVLADAISRVQWGQSTDATRYYLAGVHMIVDKGVRLESSNTHVCALAEFDAETKGEAKAIIPTATVAVIAKLLDGGADGVEIGLTPGRISVSVGDTVLSSKLIDGSFPDIRRVIPTELIASLTVDADALSEAIKRVCGASDDKIPAVGLSISSGLISVTSRGSDGEEAHDEVECDYDGAEHRITITTDYATRCVTALNADALNISISKDGLGMIWRGEGCDTSRALIMGRRGVGMDAYAEFIESKMHSGSMAGFAPLWMPDSLFDFQQSLVDWSVRKGRAALFADCGLGKTVMLLTWAENVVRHTNRPVMVLTPLAVAYQTLLEAEKFGIEAHRSSDGAVHSGINVVNYERLHHFNPSDFAGVVCDESSILKSFDGARRGEITEFMRKVEYRLLDTATAAPNDYIELGTSSEALGELGYTDMLTRFFKNDQNTIKPMRYTGYGTPRTANPIEGDHTDKWRLKPHAETAFWKYIASWARACRKPSDLGFDDARFVLPELIERDHLIETASVAEGQWFSTPAVGLKEQREERRRTIAERCEKASALVADTGQPALMWCHLNEEGNRLAQSIPDAVQVSGADSDEAKEEKFLAFSKGEVRVLVTKPKIGAWGLNFQHCAHVTTFPSHSFEQYYQGVRRCWRFGQTRPVQVDIITTEGEKSVLQNLQRKAAAADVMFDRLVSHMNDAIALDRASIYTQSQERPAWL